MGNDATDTDNRFQIILELAFRDADQTGILLRAGEFDRGLMPAMMFRVVDGSFDSAFCCVAGAGTIGGTVLLWRRARKRRLPRLRIYRIEVKVGKAIM